MGKAEEAEKARPETVETPPPYLAPNTAYPLQAGSSYTQSLASPYASPPPTEFNADPHQGYYAPSHTADSPQGYYAPPHGQQGQPHQIRPAYPPQLIAVATSYRDANPLKALGFNRGVIRCPKCGMTGPTKTSHRAGTCTHIWGLCFCFFLCIGCAPYCCNFSKDVKHRCSNCEAAVALYKRGSGNTITYY